MATKDDKFPYPTPDQIEAIFTKVETPEELSNLRGFFARNFHGVVTGHDHAFTGEHHGYDSWFEQLGSILDALEQRTFKLDIVHVIGGGSSAWACMEAKATAERKTGEEMLVPFDYAEVMRCLESILTTRQGRIIVMSLCGLCISMARGRLIGRERTMIRRIWRGLLRR